MEVRKRRPGRKAVAANQGQRVSLGLKVTPEIKNKLDAAAKENGRTQSQEAEVRIEQSFRGREYLDQAMELAYGRRLAGLLQVIARVMVDTGRYGGFLSTRTAEGAENWTDDAYAFDQVIAAVNAVLCGMRPAGEPDPPPIAAALESPLGVGLANGLLEALYNPDRGGS